MGAKFNRMGVINTWIEGMYRFKYGDANKEETTPPFHTNIPTGPKALSFLPSTSSFLHLSMHEQLELFIAFAQRLMVVISQAPPAPLDHFIYCWGRPYIMHGVGLGQLDTPVPAGEWWHTGPCTLDVALGHYLS